MAGGGPSVSISISISICLESDEVMTPDEDGNFECPECGDIIENEEDDE